MASSFWLDTETKAILGNLPPDSLAPPTTAGFSLVLLEQSSETDRLIKALRKILGDRQRSLGKILDSYCPVVVKSQLTHAEALLGQFELICSDAVSVFLRDEVATEGARKYLDELFAQLRRSPEFAYTKIRLRSIPTTPRATDFLRQFLGIEEQSLLQFTNRLPIEFEIMRKKARLMSHWGKKVGADIEAVVD